MYIIAKHNLHSRSYCPDMACIYEDINDAIEVVRELEKQGMCSVHGKLIVLRLDAFPVCGE